MAFPDALPHGALAEVFPDIFVVTGSLRMARGLTITRNMTIVRRGPDLTLINSVRLDDAGEAALAKLGTVKHLVRLGNFHGRDDPYCVDRYRPTVWMPARMTPRGDVKADKIIDDGSELPIDARAFRFREGVHDEVALRLPEAGGILITCDALQNWTTSAGCSLLGAVTLRLGGFFGPARIGSRWLALIGERGARPVHDDFRRLLELDFENMLSGHGTPLVGGARDKARASVEKTFARASPR